MENVNHPKHYNQHPSGVECIDVIRNYVCDIANAIKYLWRAGLKEDCGMTAVEKEIEDLKKSIWYIRDFIHNGGYEKYHQRILSANYVFLLPDGGVVHCKDIACYYIEDIASAITCLWNNGVIVDGRVEVSDSVFVDLNRAIYSIERRIEELSSQGIE